MFVLFLLTFGLSAVIYTARADPGPSPSPSPDPISPSNPSTITTSPVDTDYPLPHQGNVQVHDPSIIVYNDTYYLFKGAPKIHYYTAKNLSGPWTQVGTVLERDSVIDKVNRTRPWAPTIIERNGTFFCYYCISRKGSRNSSIGLATSSTAEPGSWTDHGALINTGTGDLSDTHPYTISNALDPSVIIDPADGQPWLTFGSYWTNLWQVPLSNDMMSLQNPSNPGANHVAFLSLPGRSNVILDWYPLNSDPQGARPEEGSWISYNKPYYYLWFSHGQCCNLKPKHLPPPGDEYSIRVGRATNISGPYVDINGVPLLEGGGHVVYGSNNDGQVYAPGGLGVLNQDSEPDVLFFHYLNKSIGLKDGQARLGWNYLQYNNGWPYPVSIEDEGKISFGIHSFSAENFFHLHGLILLFAWGLWFSWL